MHMQRKIEVFYNNTSNTIGGKCKWIERNNEGTIGVQWKDDNKQQIRKQVCRELKQELYIHLEGWDGEGDRREVQEGGTICISMADVSVKHQKK